MGRKDDYVTLVRHHAKVIWDSTQALKAAQEEWNALDYGGGGDPANALDHRPVIKEAVPAVPADGENPEIPAQPAQYGPSPLSPGNAHVTKGQVSSVVFDTANAIDGLFTAGHATNLAKML